MPSLRDDAEGERDRLRATFRRAEGWFTTSPLYRELCAGVAADDELLDLAAVRRRGQQPANLLFAAVHFLLLEDPDDPLAAWYPSIARAAVRSPGEGARRAFARFCLQRRGEVEHLLRTRLVQSNVVGRAGALRYAMGHVGERVDGPVALLEIGCSAGVQMRFDSYRVRVGDALTGPRDACVRVEVGWRGREPVRLGSVPPIAARAGLDLDPIDAGDPTERRWLRALVWPENLAQAAQLTAALEVVAADPPEILRGDAADGIAGLAAGLAPEAPLVVFHAAVRAHVPPQRRADFEAALLAPAATRRVLRVSLEATRESLRHPGGPCHLLALTDGSGATTPLAHVDGHGAWIEPVEPGADALEQP